MIFARSQRPAQLRMRLLGGYSKLGQASFKQGIALLQESRKHVFDADVVVIAIPAFLLCRAQHALGRRAKAREQGYSERSAMR
jgi:hypothetical protein